MKHHINLLGHGKFDSSQKKVARRWSWRGWVFFVGVIALSLVAPVLVGMRLMALSQPTVVQYHGPNPDMQLTSVPQPADTSQVLAPPSADKQDVLGVSVQKNQDQSQAASTGLSGADVNGYGIAADGGAKT